MVFLADWNITGGDIAIIVIVVLALVVFGLYKLNQWASKKMTEQESLIQSSKQQASIFVIDKRRDKAENVNMPKVFYENMNAVNKRMKMNFVKAKVGPQIVTLMCDKHIFNNLEVQKTYKVEIAGLYIVSVKGLKSASEIKQIAKDKKEKAKKEEKARKEAEKAAKKAAK